MAIKTYNMQHEYGYIVDIDKCEAARIFTSNSPEHVTPPADVKQSMLEMKNFVFVHSHTTKTELSLEDYAYYLSYDNMNAIIAVRPDGKMTSIQGPKGDKLGYYDELFTKLYKEASEKAKSEAETEYYIRDKAMKANGTGAVKYDG